MVNNVINRLFSRNQNIKESGKGIISIKRFKWSVKKGDEKSESLEKQFKNAYHNIPLIAAAIGMTTDHTIQNIYVEGENEEAIKLVKKFIKKHDFVHFLHRVCQQMFIYGNCYVEVVKDGVDIDELKILDPITMRVQRSETGDIEQYIQNIGFGKKNITFKKEEIVHFKYNQHGDESYGTSLIFPLINIIDLKCSTEDNLKLILRRYAAPIIHAKYGDAEHLPSQGDLDKLAGDLEDIYADTELISNYLLELKTVGFEGQALRLRDPLQYIENQIIAGLQVPPVLLGRGEGTNRATSEVQLAAFDRRIRSLQRAIKNTIENEFFEPLWKNNGISEDDYPEFRWGEPEITDEQTKLDQIIKLKSAGLLTAQKANDLLPGEYHEKLPEMDPMQAIGPAGQPGQKKLTGTPKKPAFEKTDTIGRGKRESENKKVEQNKDKDKGAI